MPDPRTPMTEAEVDDLLGATLHGDLPSATVQRVLATLGSWRRERGDHAARLVELQRARAEIATDDQLLAERKRLTDLFDCSAHGQGCIPHAIEAVRDLRRRQVVGSPVRPGQRLVAAPPSASCRDEWLTTFRVALHGMLAGPGSFTDCRAAAVDMADRLHGPLPEREP